MNYEQSESLLIYIYGASVHDKPLNHILCFTRTTGPIQSHYTLHVWITISWAIRKICSSLYCLH